MANFFFNYLSPRRAVIRGCLFLLINMIIDHTHPDYIKAWDNSHNNKYNGAYYYSKEIVDNIIPNVDTNRNWVTIRAGDLCYDHSIVFIHNNLHPERYDFLKKYNDLILVCGIPETVDKVSHLGTAIYLPLSIDVDYVSSFKAEKIPGSIAFAGRKSKRKQFCVPSGVDTLEGMERDKLLYAIARYDTIYAVGRTAIEAICLGCKLLPYDPRFLDVSRWQVVDNKEAAKMLQEKIDEIDGKRI